MATKPSDGHLDWINDDDPAKYIAPSAAKRLQGWLASEKPPFQYFNWFFRLVDRWLQWAEAQSDENAAAIGVNAQAISDEAAARAAADQAHADLTNNPHGVTKAQVGLASVDDLPSARYVTSSSGGPYTWSTEFDLDNNLTPLVWESIGPEGSGAMHSWAALRAPAAAGAKWVRLRIILYGTVNGQTPGHLKSQKVYARKTGATFSPTYSNMVAWALGIVTSDGEAAAANCVEATIQVDASCRFDLYIDNDFDVEYMSLTHVGWGF